MASRIRVSRRFPGFVVVLGLIGCAVTAIHATGLQMGSSVAKAKMGIHATGSQMAKFVAKFEVEGCEGDHTAVVTKVCY